MLEQMENSITVDWFLDETEYGVKHKTRYEREMEAFEEAEREDGRNGKYTGNY